jgi:hypothetical protein
MANEGAPAAVRLKRAVDPARDHVRGGNDAGAAVIGAAVLATGARTQAVSAYA